MDQPRNVDYKESITSVPRRKCCQYGLETSPTARGFTWAQGTEKKELAFI